MTKTYQIAVFFLITIFLAGCKETETHAPTPKQQSLASVTTIVSNSTSIGEDKDEAVKANINIRAMKAVMEEDERLNNMTTNSICQLGRIKTDAGCDQTANIAREYVTEAKKINMDSCPREFTEAYYRQLAAWGDFADIVSSHPHFAGFFERLMKNPQRDQEGGDAWIQRVDEKSLEIDKTREEVNTLFKRYSLGEQPASVLYSNPAVISKESVVTNLYCECHNGIFSDSVYFTNNSGQDLTRVRVAILLTGEGGGRRRVVGEYYWHEWAAGEKKSISIAAPYGVVNLKYADLSGSCDEGTIGQGSVYH